MNYLKQIIAFDKWEELHPLSDKAYRLWFKLMAIANTSGWDEWLSVPLLKLKSELHTSSDQTVMNARNSLVQAGRIEVRKGKHGKSADYRLIPFSEATSGVPNGDTSGVKSGEDSGVPSGEDSGTYYKQNKTKQKIGSSNTHTREDVFNFWQQKLNWGFPNGIVMADLTGWITEFGPDLVIFALTIAGKKQVTASAADSFLSSVFNSWRQQHISTLEQAQKANESHEKNAYNQRQQRNYYRKRPPINEPMPEWFKQQQEQGKQGKSDQGNWMDQLPDESEVPMPDD
ncbi:hypothetical protein CBG24_04600 [Limosilactobacillus reuteri]|uniref:DnaB/C C-terminal domain-containing protein n=1 Tax=Limosilactobacillus reuteri TaxID=1598 RepID=A0AB73RIP8_LIMRT|nr:DnaD domain protein [Limosilactobacillus reuteri]OYS87601.1 hypothetical protein CBG19_04395 [Limosilactobacillus reuteri]OYS90753.1 hypothetical protein CBG18_05080 [Limosilactobacillus reuteri]OYS94072.1 hypothetical protein CBG15_04860 [Limosilactobacillus reuteri]OYS95665.1 hypothetical protein CBG10_04135 [Limosilactobacillus reuteri]OYS97458.1 hypothetical protein CBG13_04270 [Limosilactobacillus reuteri]